jgi:hypothetical protein
MMFSHTLIIFCVGKASEGFMEQMIENAANEMTQ